MAEEKLVAGLPENEHIASGHRACAGCACILAVRHALKAAGKNTIVVSATGCMEVVTSPYPQTAWKVPWIHATFENAGAVASGVAESLKKQGNERASLTADTKEEAIKKMREFMSDKTGSVKIHKVDGKYQEERTYQRKDDPKKSPG